MTITVTFSLWQRRRKGTLRNLQKSQRGRSHGVATPSNVYLCGFRGYAECRGVFVANLLCYSSAEDETIHVLEGEDCALQFLHDSDDLVDVPDSDEEREIIVVFHNLKGFDGMFILQELYQ